MEQRDSPWYAAFNWQKPKVPLVLALLATAGLQAAVLITSPENGKTLASPVELKAVASGPAPAAYFVYDNGLLMLERSGVSSIAASLTLPAGNHTITVETTGPRGLQGSASVSIYVSASLFSDPPGSTSAVAVQISNDMTGQNEGFPQGVPSHYNWYWGPTITMGNNSSGWQAIEGWGVVYVASQGSTATNTRVNLRRVQTWVLSRSTHSWSEVQFTNQPDGAGYLDDFTGGISGPGNVRVEPDGTISMMVFPGSGYNYHFYPYARGSINPKDIGGIVTLFEARLILDNPALPDDRTSAHYLCSGGADYYPTLQGRWPGNTVYNPGVATGKFKYVTIPWRSFAMTTLSASALEKNPPPIDLAGTIP